MPNKIKIWIKAVRAPFFTAVIVPVILGSALAWYDTNSFMWARFWLTIIGAIFVHAGTNLVNDYFDHISGCDEKNLTPTPFSGGSRVIQERLLTPQKVLYASLIFFFLGGILGLYLNYVSGGNAILILGIIGVFLGFFYTALPIHIGYSTFGELAVGIGFGPLIVLGAYYVQAHELSFKAFLVSIPIGILIALVLYINEFPDHDTDKSVGKKTLVVLLGKRNAVVLYHLLLGITYLFILFFVIFKVLPIMCLIALLSMPLAIKAFLVSRKNFDNVYKLIPANAATIGLHLLIGLLLSAGIMLDKLF